VCSLQARNSRRGGCLVAPVRKCAKRPVKVTDGWYISRSRRAKPGQASRRLHINNNSIISTTLSRRQPLPSMLMKRYPVLCLVSEPLSVVFHFLFFFFALAFPVRLPSGRFIEVNSQRGRGLMIPHLLFLHPAGLCRMVS